MTALAFELHPTLADDGSLRIRVDSPSGQVTEERPLKGQQLQGWLTSARAFIPDDRQVWRGTSGGVEGAVAEARANIEQALSTTDITAVAGELFSVVFRGQIRALYNQSVGRAEAAGEALRVHCHFELDDPREARLATLPWEQLHDPVHGSFMALDNRTPVSRFLRYPGVSRTVRLPQELRVLVVSASPANMKPITISFPSDEEWPQAHIVVERLVDPDGETLERALRKGAHVLHIDSHGEHDPLSGVGTLMLVKKGSRQTERVTGAQLASWVKSSPGLRVVVLNACQSSGSSGRRAFADVASALVRAGVPAVIGMRDVIPDADAVRFARALYTGLISGRTLEASVSSARRALYSAKSPYWSWPMFYSHAAEAFSIPVDVKAPLARVFSWLGALIAAMSINTCSRIQGGPPLVPGTDYAMVHKETAPIFGALAVGVLLWGLLLVTVRYQWESHAKGLFFRLPIPFDLPIAANRSLAQLFQGLVLAFFLVVPLYAQLQSLGEIYRDTTWSCTKPYDEYTKHSTHLTRFTGPSVLWDHKYCYGPKKSTKPVPSDSNTIREVTFFPFWQPWFFLLLGICNVVLLVVVLVGLRVRDAYSWSGWVLRGRSWMIGLLLSATAMALAALWGATSSEDRELKAQPSAEVQESTEVQEPNNG